jgi:hypothetical protein
MPKHGATPENSRNAEDETHEAPKKISRIPQQELSRSRERLAQRRAGGAGNAEE